MGWQITYMPRMKGCFAQAVFLWSYHIWGCAGEPRRPGCAHGGGPHMAAQARGSTRDGASQHRCLKSVHSQQSAQLSAHSSAHADRDTKFKHLSWFAGHCAGAVPAAQHAARLQQPAGMPAGPATSAQMLAQLQHMVAASQAMAAAAGQSPGSCSAGAPPFPSFDMFAQGALPVLVFFDGTHLVGWPLLCGCLISVEDKVEGWEQPARIHGAVCCPIAGMLQSGGAAMMPFMQSLATMLPGMLAGSPSSDMAPHLPTALAPGQAPETVHAQWPLPHQNGGGAEAAYAAYLAAMQPAAAPFVPAAQPQQQQWPPSQEAQLKQQQQPDWAALAASSAAPVQGLPLPGSYPGPGAAAGLCGGAGVAAPGGLGLSNGHSGSHGFSVGDMSAQSALLLALGAPALKMQQEQQRLHGAGSQ